MNTKNIKLGLLLLVISTLLPGCGDSVSDPVYLDSQQELSKLAKDRHYSVKLFYEGKTNDSGNEVYVFAEVIISKFTPGRSINLFYLPADKIVLNTDVGNFGGEKDLKLNHRFYYYHDNGTFYMYKGAGKQNDKLLESVKAGFTEKYSLAEERCVDAQQAAQNNPGDDGKTDYAASICFYSKNFEASRIFTQKLKTGLNGFPSSARGKAMHKYHTHQGRLLLHDGNIEGAKEQLLLSLEVKPDATMRSFGPNMSLARDLLAKGEREIVIEYLDGCSVFWKDAQVEQWKGEINQGKVPDFGANLNY